MNVLTTENIKNKVYIIRGQQVMLDSDLAEIYGYEVKALNQQVKRNIARFPGDFMFQLTSKESNLVKSQIVTSPDQANFFSGQDGGRRKLPYAFTEQGIYMLATVLKGELAEQQSVFIMRAFRELRHYVQENKQFVTQNEMRLLSAKVDDLSIRLDTLNENFISNTDLKEFVIYKDHKFEADVAYIDIYSTAKKSIYVIDDYVNTKTLQLLSHKKSHVGAILFTQNRPGKNGKLTETEIEDFNREYPSLIIKNNPDCHDRFIILDYHTKDEMIFHYGHSSKDAGNKICAIIEFTNTDLLHPMIDEYLKM